MAYRRLPGVVYCEAPHPTDSALQCGKRLGHATQHVEHVAGGFEHWGDHAQICRFCSRVCGPNPSCEQSEAVHESRPVQSVSITEVANG